MIRSLSYRCQIGWTLGHFWFEGQPFFCLKQLGEAIFSLPAFYYPTYQVTGSAVFYSCVTIDTFLGFSLGGIPHLTCVIWPKNQAIYMTSFYMCLLGASVTRLQFSTQNGQLHYRLLSLMFCWSSIVSHCNLL